MRFRLGRMRFRTARMRAFIAPDHHPSAVSGRPRFSERQTLATQLLLRWRIHADMTEDSRDSPHVLTHGEIEQLLTDLRRQRESLEQQKTHLSVSAEATAALVQKIEGLRARADTLQPRPPETKT